MRQKQAARKPGPLLSRLDEMADEEEEYPADGGWSYARFIENLGIQPPYRWIAGLEGVARTTLEVPVRLEYSHPFLEPACVSPTVAEGGLYDGAEGAPAT